MKRSIQTALLALLVTGMLGSCKKKLEDAYQNPNAPVRVPVETLLPQMISSMAANFLGIGPINDARYASMYIQYFGSYTVSATLNTSTQFERMGGTTGASDVAGSIWRSHYYDLGQNCVKMMEWAEEEKKWDYVGVGKAMFAWSWLQLTDYHGEVILKDAFRTDLLTFRFDTEEEVYAHVRKTAFEALDYLNRTGDGVSQQNLAKGDAFFYNGDVNKWKKFVYAVLARSYNHLSNKSIYKPDSVIYYCDRALATADDDAMVKFQATPGLSADNNFYGPLRNNLGSGYAVRQSAYITNLMKGTNPVFSGVFDPRIWYMLRPSISGEFNGITLNGGIGSIPATANRPEGFWGQRHDSLVPPANDLRARYIFRNASPMPVLTACEVQFMKAEAALRKGDRTTALAAYRKGIELSFDMLQTYFSTNVPTDRLLTTAVRESFLANPQVVPTAANLTLSHIMLQKYIALYGYGALETWVDMRRYHYTDRDGSGNQVYRDFVVPSETSVPAIWPDNNGKLAYRVRYRYNSEYVWNIEELKRIGADALDWHTKEVWFSKP